MNRSGGGRPLYGYIQGFGFSEYLTETHPSDRNINSPRSNMPGKPADHVSQQIPSAWNSQDTHQDSSQPSSLNTSDFAQDNIYEVCGERSGPVEITVQVSPNPMQNTLSMDSSTSGGYGSIPHLEASPRRYRYIDSDSDSMFHRDSPSSSLNVPTAVTRQGNFSLTGQIEISDSPPKLPERAPKTLNTGAPPPLPPKKPLSNQSSKTSMKNMSMNSNVALMAACFAESSKMGCNDDIYDFPPEPMIGNVNLNQEEAKQCISDILKTSKPVPKPASVMPDLGSVTIEELSRMSVMELNEKMTAGLIPEELKGMSIFELVDFVAKHMRLKKDEDEEEDKAPSIPGNVEYSTTYSGKSDVSGMKPSFSDNFVAEKLLSTPKSEQSNSSHAPLLSNLDIISGITKSPLTNVNSNVSSNTDELSKCFEDDFAHFNKLPTSSISGRESVMTDQDKEPIYDKYAVFRELQLEEELLRAWKTPSDEEKDTKDQNLRGAGLGEQEDNNEDDEDKSEDNEDDDDDEDEDKPNDLIGQDEDSQERPICSSEGSPRSRSDTGSIQKSVSEDGTLDDLKIGSEIQDQAGRENDQKRESQIPIFFVDEGNGEEVSEDEVAENPKSVNEKEEPHLFQRETEEANNFEANFEAEMAAESGGEKAAADPNKFEHNFDEAFGPSGGFTVTKDWTTFEDDSMQQFGESEDDGQQQQQQQQLHGQDQFAGTNPDNDQYFSMGSFSAAEEQLPETDFERLKEDELRQQRFLYEEHQRLQAELQHQHALQRELQFHRQVKFLV